MSLLVSPTERDVWHHQVLALDQQHGILGLQHLERVQHLVVGLRLWAEQQRLEELVRHPLVPIPHPQWHLTVVAKDILQRQSKVSESESAHTSMPVLAWSINRSVTLTAMLGSADFLVRT